MAREASFLANVTTALLVKTAPFWAKRKSELPTLYFHAKDSVMPQR